MPPSRTTAAYFAPQFVRCNQWPPRQEDLQKTASLFESDRRFELHYHQELMPNKA